LLAANSSLEEMCDFIGADSLAFLTVDGLYKAMGHKNGRDNDNPAYTDHCFTGDYPTQLQDQKNDEKIQQLSLLSERR
jgi:amidophosphoribosyltransferase